MPKYVYVQIEGVDKPARIRADEIKQESESKGTHRVEKLVLVKDGTPVGEFAPKSIVGWWIQDE